MKDINIQELVDTIGRLHTELAEARHKYFGPDFPGENLCVTHIAVFVAAAVLQTLFDDELSEEAFDELHRVFGVYIEECKEGHKSYHAAKGVAQ